MKKYNEKGSYLSLTSILFVAVITLVGCNNAMDYSGDGQLVDKGKKAATDRYVLNLGTIDLDKQGTKAYRIINLPKTNFVIGFEICFPKARLSAIESKAINSTVLLELSNSEGRIIFSKQSSLASWTWSVPSNEPKAFIYGREKPGTYFTPVPQIEYTLTLTVVKPLIEKIEYSAQLLAKSGGWK